MALLGDRAGRVSQSEQKIALKTGRDAACLDQTTASQPKSRGARAARASGRKGDSDKPNAPWRPYLFRLRPRCDAVRASASGVGPPRVITIVSGCSPVPRERAPGPDLSPTTVFALYHTGQGRRGA